MIYIKSGNGWEAGWITERKLKNALKKGEKLKVSDKYKKQYNEIRKEIRTESQKEKTVTKSNNRNVGYVSKSKRNKPKQKVSNDTVKRKSGLKEVYAPKIQFNKSALNEIKKRLRKNTGKRGNPLFPKEYYESVLQRARDERLTLEEMLNIISDENKGVIVYSTDKSETFHFQTGTIIDRISGDGGDMAKGAEIVITDFQGDEFTFTSVANAMKLISELNAKLNNTIGNIQNAMVKKKGKSYPIYVWVPETSHGNSKGETTKIEQNFSEYRVEGIDKATFDYYLQNEIE